MDSLISARAIKMESGLVSTIIPVRNRPTLLPEAVQSVISQTYSRVEIIIVNDASTDDTGDVVNEIARQYPRIVRPIHHQRCGGPGVARESARQVAKGEYVQYLDSDDILLPRKFELQVSGLKANPSCGVAYGKTNYYRYGDVPSKFAWKRTGEEIDKMYPSFLESRWWGTSTPLYRRSVIEKAGSWSNLYNEEDWEYDCRIASQGIKLFYQDDFVSHQRDHGFRRLSQKELADAKKIRDRIRAHDLIYHHASSFGLNQRDKEMKHFSRECFLLSRQAGQLGLVQESMSAFELAKNASGLDNSDSADIRKYFLLATVIGWKQAGWVSHYIDKVRSRVKI